MQTSQVIFPFISLQQLGCNASEKLQPCTVESFLQRAISVTNQMVAHGTSLLSDLTRNYINLDETCGPLQGQTAFEREAEAPLSACQSQSREEWVERERKRALWVLCE